MLYVTYSRNKQKKVNEGVIHTQTPATEISNIMFWRAWEKVDRKNGTEMNSKQHIEMKQSSAVYTQRQMTIIKAVQRIAQAE